MALGSGVLNYRLKSYFPRNLAFPLFVKFVVSNSHSVNVGHFLGFLRVFFCQIFEREKKKIYSSNHHFDMID